MSKNVSNWSSGHRADPGPAIDCKLPVMPLTTARAVVVRLGGLDVRVRRGITSFS